MTLLCLLGEGLPCWPISLCCSCSTCSCCWDRCSTCCCQGRSQRRVWGIRWWHGLRSVWLNKIQQTEPNMNLTAWFNKKKNHKCFDSCWSVMLCIWCGSWCSSSKVWVEFKWSLGTDGGKLYNLNTTLVLFFLFFFFVGVNKIPLHRMQQPAAQCIQCCAEDEKFDEIQNHAVTHLSEVQKMLVLHQSLGKAQV